jgi:hypothetical protein
MRICCQHFEQSSKVRQIKVATVKGTTQKKLKRQPNESTGNMSCKLFIGLVSLFRKQTDSIIEDVNDLMANYTEKDLQEALLEKGEFGNLPIHLACMCGAPIEVIQLLLDNDDDKKTILEKDNDGRLPIHYACVCSVPVELIQLLLDSDTGKKTIPEKDNYGKLPIDLACGHSAPVEVIQLLLQKICD